MNINIREYIKNNFKESDINELKESILASIESNDEVVLPGLGVLFEVLWNNSSNELKDEILKTIDIHIKKNN